MKEVEFATKTIGDIVAQDFRTATIFREAGIDFCCGGRKSLDEACSEKGIDPVELRGKLENINDIKGTVTHKFNEWQPGFLCDYIVNVHHAFLRKSLPDLVFYTRKIANVHGSNHPELVEVADLFSQINRELLVHMKKEEDVLFPAVKDLFDNNSEKSKAIIRKEINGILSEHEFAGGAMDSINTITNGYKLPGDACNSYRLTFDLLENFENDLHTHVHLENNILIPRTMNELN